MESSVTLVEVDRRKKISCWHVVFYCSLLGEYERFFTSLKAVISKNEEEFVLQSSGLYQLLHHLQQIMIIQFGHVEHVVRIFVHMNVLESWLI